MCPYRKLIKNDQKTFKHNPHFNDDCICRSNYGMKANEGIFDITMKINEIGANFSFIGLVTEKQQLKGLFFSIYAKMRILCRLGKI